MSREEKFFNPKSLVRIATAVQWEPDLVLYADGSFNQERYMEALAILYRNWLSGEELPFALAQVEAVASENWIHAFQNVVESFPGKLAQFVGFWTGILGRKANKSLFGPLIGPEDIGQTPETSSSIEERAYLIVDQLLLSISSIMKGVPYGKD